jgi:membrane-bound lytic murein transglycosylase D
MKRKSQIGGLVLLFAFGLAAAAEPFPEPPELKPDVDFWIGIFTRYTTDQGVLHDARNLGVVYERIDFPHGLDRRERQRRVVGRRKAIQAVLAKLASGKRDNLSSEEARILALWPADVSTATLVDASRNIRYQQGLSDRFREGLIRAGRWRPYIEDELRAVGVPVELAALPHVESSYNPDARSNVGASGIWQFTRSTGRRYMRIDHVVDERNDPFLATRAAGRLLAYNYSITGNWPMAITAYNHGLAGVRRAMHKYGDDSYTDIIRKYNGRTFGFASRNFYVAFLAAMQVDRDADKYFPGLAVEQPIDYYEFELDDYISAADLAAALGITTKQLWTSNPALQATVFQGSKYLPKGFDIRVPKRLLDDSIDKLVAAIPADAWQTAQLPDLFHTIRRGETLSEIAEEYQTRISTLVALNNLGSANRIRAGQRLRLPAAGPAPTVVAAEPEATVAAAEPEVLVAAAESEAAVSADDSGTETAAGPADGALVTEEESGSIAGEIASDLIGTIQTALLSDPSDYSVADDDTIEIQPLETLGHFADWLEIRTQRLRDINGLAFHHPVDVGQRIRLDLSKVDAKTFEDRRVAYHRAQQDTFFREHVISGVKDHVIAPGESIWILALRKYDVPMWLFRQYNPEVDPDTVRPGTRVQFPVLSPVGET